MPPTSGWGHSERLFWFMEDISGREGVLFPPLRVKRDPPMVVKLADEVDEIVSDFRKTGKYNEGFLKDLEEGLEKNKVTKER